MDLLKSLIVPGTQSYEDWRIRHFKTDASHPSGSGVPDRRDSVQHKQHQSQAQHPIHEDLSKPSASILNNHQQDESSSVPKSELNSTNKQETRQKYRLCFFWYHYGECNRDPTNEVKPERPCPFIHSLEAGKKDIKLSHFPAGTHKKPCGLDLCPLKDKNSKSKKRPDGEQKAENKDDIASKAAVDNADASDPKKVVKEKKRKAAFRHPDEPAQGALKRQKVSYDESTTASEKTASGEETCFFWYHGRCPRSLDPRSNYQCGYKHELTDLPSMVQPPPGYTHPKPCGLDWCPGDSLLPQSVPKQDKTIHEIKERLDLHRDLSKDDKRRTVSSGDQQSDQVCFFWYHGKCKRRPCLLKHKMSDPPHMIQPPPGYVHKEPCDREWCPGDAKEEINSDKRYFENVIGEGAMAEGDDKDQDWYLSGFEE